MDEVSEPADEDMQRVWLEEAQRRHREIVEGRVQAIPAERVFAELRVPLEDCRRSGSARH
jgi:hypothetical protein